MHINVFRLHNADMLRHSRTCPDTAVVPQQLPCASPLFLASTFHPCNAGPPLGLTQVSSACPHVPAFFFPHLHNHADPSSETHVGGVRCQTSCSLPPPRAAGRSLWKNYSDICMCHSYKAPGTYPPAHQPTLLMRLPPFSLPPVCAAPPPCTCGNHFSNY